MNSFTFLLLFVIPFITADCGVHDQIHINNEFCRPPTDGKEWVQVGDDSDGTDYTWTVTVHDTHLHNDDGYCKPNNDGQYSRTFQGPGKKKMKYFAEKFDMNDDGHPPCNCTGRYEIERTRGTGPTKETKKWSILFVNDNQTPYHFFSKEVIRKLIKYQYYYLHMSHFFQSSDNFLPHVSKFFRGYADRALELAQKTIKYTIEKKETLALMHGVPRSERYDTDGTAKENHFFHDIFNVDHVKGASIFPTTLTMKGFFNYEEKPAGAVEQAFEQAVHWEKVLMTELTKALKKAENLCDSELIEYISAELMPGQRTTVKLLEDHKMTLKNMRASDDSPINVALTEFVFDSEM